MRSLPPNGIARIERLSLAVTATFLALVVLIGPRVVRAQTCSGFREVFRWNVLHADQAACQGTCRVGDSFCPNAVFCYQCTCSTMVEVFSDKYSCTTGELIHIDPDPNNPICACNPLMQTYLAEHSDGGTGMDQCSSSCPPGGGGGC